jgi:hydrogenase/urease accessory protein HupE
VLLRKRAADGEFNLFTDRQSQIKYYKHIQKGYLMCCVPALILIAYFYVSIVTAHLNTAREFALSWSFFVHPLSIAAHILFLINIGLAVSSFQQWRRYTLRIKNLKCDSIVFE